MSIRKVLLSPDPLLKSKAKVVDLATQLDTASSLAQDLLDTLCAFNHCVGIAAPQLGELLQLVVVDCTRHRKDVSNHGQLILINPVIVDRSGSDIKREGCLSIPDFTANVRRSTRITVKASDLSGNELNIESEDFEARVIQHELDHLDGILFLDRVASLDRDVFRRKTYR